jgi:DNA-binding SARP family transcriptional activator
VQDAVDDSVRFDLLGPLRARRGLRELDLGPGKQRAVLAALLLAANRAVPPSQIIDMVWGDEPPENGTNVVQKYVAGLRRVLEPDRAPRSAGQLLTLTEGGYRLSVAPGNSDLDVFTDYVRQARQLRAAGRLEDASRGLQSALALWRAEPLAGLTGSFFESTRARLTNDRATALEDWAELELDQGHQQALLPELSPLVAEFPLRERLRAVQMLALYRTGRQAEALSVYREARRLLVDAHGVDPGPDLQALHNRILQNDPTLDTPPATSAVGASPAQDSPATAPEPPPAPWVSPAPPAPGSWPAAPPTAGWAGIYPAPGQWPSPVVPAVGVVAPDRLTWRDWVLKFAVAAVPILSVSLAAGPLMGILAIRRRSIRLGIAAAAYLAASVAGYIMIDSTTSSDEITSTTDGIGIVLVIVTSMTCAVHAAVIVPRRGRQQNLAIELRRQQARQIAADHPQIARQLGIGRPDLPNQFDDGGLVDVNDAPAEALQRLPGITAQQASLIVADRTYRGRFHSLEELAGRGLVSWPIPQELADALLIISIQDTIDEDRR